MQTRPWRSSCVEASLATGVVVAAYAPEPQQRATALEVLQAAGAQDIETAEGHWRDGQWIDFDPVASPGEAATADVALSQDHNRT